MNAKMKRVVLGVMMCGVASVASAAEVKAAVAANFTATMKELAAKFEAKTGDKVTLSFGSSGKLYTQIVNGAPYDVFLSADTARPEQLEQEGGAVKGSRFTYAMGRLALWSAQPELVDAEGTVLNSEKFERLAIANPKTAPYGAAAVEVLQGLGLYEKIEPRIVQGDNIAQTYQFVATGNAQLGFVALAQVKAKPSGSWWQIPQDYYTPIRQDAVLLKSAADNKAARALLDYLRSPEAKQIIEQSGYGVE